MLEAPAGCCAGVTTLPLGLRMGWPYGAQFTVTTWVGPTTRRTLTSSNTITARLPHLDPFTNRLSGRLG